MQEIPWKPDMTDIEYASYKMAALYLGREVIPQFPEKEQESLSPAAASLQWFRERGINAYIYESKDGQDEERLFICVGKYNIEISNAEILYRATLFNEKIVS